MLDAEKHSGPKYFFSYTGNVDYTLLLQNYFSAMDKMDVPWRTYLPPCHPNVFSYLRYHTQAGRYIVIQPAYIV